MATSRRVKWGRRDGGARRAWFDRLTTSGMGVTTNRPLPLTLSLSKGEPVSVVRQAHHERRGEAGRIDDSDQPAVALSP